MSGIRASKRRRLEDAVSTPSPRKEVPQRKKGSAIQAASTPAQEELDIYDDIEGAHNPSQEAQTKRSTRITPVDKSAKTSRTSTRAKPTPRTTTKTADLKPSDSDDELAGPQPNSIPRKPSRQTTEKIAPTSSKKRTFEDEIKEVQEAARKEVNTENSTNGSSTTPKVTRHGKIEPGKLSKTATIQPTERELIKTILMGKLCRKRPVALSGLQEEYTKVSALITQTITAGESNSMLIIGSRGCGKTTLLDQVLREQTEQRPDDFVVVRLNGFIHTDDKIALREIWRQLGREVDVDEESSTTQNYADTMTTLLALLSHGVDEEDRRAGRVSKSVVFVLDEFDLFAGHPRQTLLYNLFDIAQSRKAPIAVVGLTTRIDVVESLEKRVKSRFSHRYVHLGLARSFEAFSNVCKSGLNVFVDELSTAEHEMLVAGDSSTEDLDGSISTWNAFVDKLFDDKRFTEHLKRLYYTTKSIQQFFMSQIVPLYTLPDDGPLKAKDFVDHFAQSQAVSSLAGPDSRLDLLSSLSSLQLALLICAARLNTIHDSETVTFALVYEEYKTLGSKAKIQASVSGALAGGSATRVFSKNIARDAWAEVLETGLVMDDGRGSGRVDVALYEIATSDADLGAWGKWCKEI